jgi:outer membrane immunogenic protein
MKKLFGIIVLLQAFTIMAEAAPPSAPVSSWSGFYVGGNLGGAWGSVNADYSVNLLADPSNSQNMSGAIGGVQAGYNWQQGDWVLGLVTDFQLSSQTSNSIIDPFAFTDDHSIDLPWFGTVRGNVGFTPNAPWLIYATGGFAYGYVEESNIISGLSINGSHSFVQDGWTVGGGVQVVLANNWTATFEYLYLDFGTFDDAAGPLTTSSHLTDNVVRVGLNYFFH